MSFLVSHNILVMTQMTYEPLAQVSLSLSTIFGSQEALALT